MTRPTPPRPRVRPWVVALALGAGALGLWWPRLLPWRRGVAVATGVVDVRSDSAVDPRIVRVAEEAGRRVRAAGLAIPARQLVLLCRSRACWFANPSPRWSRATTRLFDGLVVLSPWVPLGPLPAAAEAPRPGGWARPLYWSLPASRHECAVRVLLHELAHVADIRRRGRLRAWRAGAGEAEAFASRVARATARPDSALGPTECAGADGMDG
ncbi:hypothetical protein [Roseisolibacter sp. H3M3-2]|uniref:hypothetical protein n=1 Tax=Roseisolibacter sp. H3M3-2 TaxID=3031323 RepID=UPI0023DB90DB|nr:hypothetical protein [Roseisolibacter sp. H3M3-2]MDF1503660.1 hypothetical protein [Roseisolibacter sp. H3M3-2]